MPDDKIALIAQLLRRAGFGSTPSELEKYASQSYEDVVEDLLHPERAPEIDEDVVRRYYPELNYADALPLASAYWVYRMVNSKRPLEEKIALFWHHVFATAWYKSEHPGTMVRQIDIFRRLGLEDMRTILLALSKDPGMLHWLDNCENHGDEPNENYGRELLELFSMGVGNYTEQDIKSVARAFTGWTFDQPIPLYPHGNYPSSFLYRDEDHDDDVKTFLGQTGRFNGEDIVDIIVRQPATARFVSRHLYNFFVADEAQVPAWERVPPQDIRAIATLEQAYEESGGEIRAILRVLFNADFFKEARFKRVKSPAELVAGTIKLVGTFQEPEPGMEKLNTATTNMGQQLMNPPTVEGWHTGREWIDGATLNERVNFGVDQMSDLNKPGICEIARRLGSSHRSLEPEELVDRCLELLGPLEVDPQTRDGLLEHASAAGILDPSNGSNADENIARVAAMLQLIVSSVEYQFA